MKKIKEFIKDNSSELPMIFEHIELKNLRIDKKGKASYKMVRNKKFNTNSYRVTKFFKNIIRC